MDDLRAQVHHIVNSGEIGIPDHPEAIAAISTPHTIRHIGPVRPYNCFQHALGLEPSSRIHRLLKEDVRNIGRYRRLAFGMEFMKRLISKGILIEDTAGTIIIYFKDSEPVHAGKVGTNGRVTSKWGLGHLWEHETWEVPASYGQKCQLYQLARPDEVEGEFELYTEELKT